MADDNRTPQAIHRRLVLPSAEALDRYGYYFVIPPRLLAAALREMRKNALDRDRVQRDRELSEQLSQPGHVGWWKNGLIHHELLRERESPRTLRRIDQATMEFLGWSESHKLEQVNRALWEVAEIRTLIQRARRAYCGWLTVNRRFIEEHDALLNEWMNMVHQHGMPAIARRLDGLAADPERGMVEEPNELTTFLDAFESFYRRWHIQGLAGPRLPVPVAPQLPEPAPHTQPAHIESDAMMRLSVPRMLPVPGGELLRTMAEGAASRDAAGDHLAEWGKLISNANTGKQALTRYARLFELQHDWRLLHRRYGAACYRCANRLKAVFAEFLHVEHSTVRADLKLICRQLGADWLGCD